MTKQDLDKKIPMKTVMGFSPIRDIFCKHIDKLTDADFVAKLPEEVSFQDFIDDFGISVDTCEKVWNELQAFEAAMKSLQEKEAAQFDVPVDLDDNRFKWSNEDTSMQELCVSRIEELYSGRKNEIIFYGPSNITLWYSLEKDMLPLKAQNHGMGGCIDSEMITYAPRLLYPFAPSVVFFQTGSNDLANGIPLETILANKKKMYDLFLEKMPDTKLVVMSGLPLPGRTQFWDDTVKTNALLKEMCDNTPRMYFMDATDALLSATGPDRLKTSDGRYFSPQYYRQDAIHLNKPGHDVWTKCMKEMLEKINREM